MTLARDRGLAVVEKRISRDEIYCADEAFFTGTAAEITAVRELDRRCIGSGKPGPVTRVLQDDYFAVVHGRSSAYSHWLKKVAAA
jgi:branched-chain amino acid aminotransferase